MSKFFTGFCLSKRKSLTEERGFTLIELLVVIAIISLLSSVVLASLSSARASARDARRVSDMQQIMTAIELYRNQHGYIPGHGGACDLPEAADGSENTKLRDESHCIVQELEKVMTTVPTDPTAGNGFYYAYDPTHNSSSNKCDDTSSLSVAILGFNKSETGIDDRENTVGGDLNLNDAAYNRIICWD